MCRERIDHDCRQWDDPHRRRSFRRCQEWRPVAHGHKLPIHEHRAAQEIDAINR
jgi:hypothetical protein